MEDEKKTEVKVEAYLGDKELLSLVDIDNKWQDVALSSLCAVCCALPFVGCVFAVVWMWKYAVRPTFHCENFCGALNEVLLWLMVGVMQYESTKTCLLSYFLVDQGQLPLAAQVFQATLVVQACWIGSLFWRVLVVEALDTGAHVSMHKLKARKEFRKDSASLQRKPKKVATHRASEFLVQLGVETQFEATPADLESKLREVHIPWWHYLVIAASTAAAALMPVFAANCRQAMFKCLCEEDHLKDAIKKSCDKWTEIHKVSLLGWFELPLWDLVCHLLVGLLWRAVVQVHFWHTSNNAELSTECQPVACLSCQD